jgi:hypothetical protein
MSKTIGVLLILGCLCLLARLPQFARVNTGRILGTVTDRTGGVIAGATVTMTNTQTGVARNLTTDQAGEYNAPNLPTLRVGPSSHAGGWSPIPVYWTSFNFVLSVS